MPWPPPGREARNCRLESLSGPPFHCPPARAAGERAKVGPSSTRASRPSRREAFSMDVLDRLDAVVDEYVRGNRFYAAYPTPEIARMWIKQHRLNTRIRNSVMKLSVA